MNKYVLKIPSDVVDSPIISTIVLQTGVLVNILRAKVDYDEGVMIVSILGDQEQQKKVVEALKRLGVEVSRLKKNIMNDIDKCVNCGACIALCPTSALLFEKDMTLRVEADKCIRCGACVSACPRKSLSIQTV